MKRSIWGSSGRKYENPSHLGATIIHMPATVLGSTEGAETCLTYLGGRIRPHEARALATRTDGIVLRRTSGERTGRELRTFLNYRGALLFDPAYYEGDPSRIRIDLRHEALRQAQLRVATFLSPSRFAPDGDIAALNAVLRAGTDFANEATTTGHDAPVRTVVAIQRPWLTRHVEALIEAVAIPDVPPVLVLGNRTDPLDSGVAVRGFRKLLDARPGLGLIRSDLASIGALAHGATLIAPGTATVVRHFVPHGKTGGGVSYDDTPSVLVPTLDNYFKGSKLELARDREDEDLLRCKCFFCKGRSLTRFGDPRLTPEALRHNAESVFTMFEHFRDSPQRLRRTHWAMACAKAVEMHERLSELTGVPFTPSSQLRAWAEWH